MKNIAIVTLFIAIVVTLFISLADKKKMITVVEGNFEKRAIPIEVGKFQDIDCGMVIDDLKFSAQIILDSGKTYFFHDVGGVANYLKDKEFKDSVKIWVYAIDTNEWIDGREALYSIDELTPMNYGFGAYKNRKDEFITYKEMFLRMARGENLNNPYIRAKILGE